MIEKGNVNSTMTIQTKENEPLIYIDTNVEGCINVCSKIISYFDLSDRITDSFRSDRIRLKKISDWLCWWFVCFSSDISNRSWIFINECLLSNLAQGQGIRLSRKKRLKIAFLSDRTVMSDDRFVQSMSDDRWDLNSNQTKYCLNENGRQRRWQKTKRFLWWWMHLEDFPCQTWMMSSKARTDTWRVSLIRCTNSNGTV